MDKTKDEVMENLKLARDGALEGLRLIQELKIKMELPKTMAALKDFPRISFQEFVQALAQ